MNMDIIYGHFYDHVPNIAKALSSQHCEMKQNQQMLRVR
jgi:hypothetical protein